MGTAERADGSYWELPGPGGMALGAGLGLRPAPASMGPEAGVGVSRLGPAWAWWKLPEDPSPSLGGSSGSGDRQRPACWPRLGQPSLPRGPSRHEGWPGPCPSGRPPVTVLLPLTSTLVLLAGWFTLQV